MSNVTINLTGDEARLLRALDKVIEKEKQVRDGFKETATQTKGDGDAFLSGTVQNYITGLATVGGAIEGIKLAWRQMREEQEIAARSIEGGESGLRRLAQLAETPQDLAHLKAEAEKTSRETGMSLDRAQALQFAIESQQLGGERGLFSQVSQFAGAEPLSTGVGKMIAGFGAGEVGGARAAINKLLVAAKTSDVDVESFAPTAAIFAGTAGAIGASDEEALAALSVLSPVFKSSETAGERIRALASFIQRKGFGGKGFKSGMEAIGADISEMTDVERGKYFGSQEVQQGYTAYAANAGRIDDLAGLLDFEGGLGPGDDAVARRLAVVGSDPGLSALRDREAALRQKELGLADEYGSMEIRRQAEVARQTSLREGEGFLTRWGRGTLAGWSAGSPTATERDVARSGDLGAIIGDSAAGSIGDFGPIAPAKIITLLLTEIRDRLRPTTLARPDEDR